MTAVLHRFRAGGPRFTYRELKTKRVESQDKKRARTRAETGSPPVSLKCEQRTLCPERTQRRRMEGACAGLDWRERGARNGPVHRPGRALNPTAIFTSVDRDNECVCTSILLQHYVQMLLWGTSRLRCTSNLINPDQWRSSPAGRIIRQRAVVNRFRVRVFSTT
jgi:hypothetical protein